MDTFPKIKQYILLFGDIFTLYAALVLVLLIRYGNLFYRLLFEQHIGPFTILFIIWITIFYIAGLYELKSLKNNIGFDKIFWTVIPICLVIGVIFFYAQPKIGITPKTNLLIFFLIFSVINYSWRKFYNLLLNKTGGSSKILLVGNNETTNEIAQHIEQNPQLGYEIKYWMKDSLEDKEFEHLSQIIISNNINIIVVPAHIKKDSKSSKLIYRALMLGIDVLDLSALYELVFQKVPLEELEEVWFLENITQKNKTYKMISKPIEYLFAIIFSIISLPFFIITAIIVKLTSPGPIIFKQRRIGFKNTEFTIYKFRTMRVDAEKNGPQWANFDDARATPVGRFLRRSHLDELPQIINILKGDISFIGPRPERPEFVTELKKHIPYYELRLLTKPGITGWAQINFKYGSSVKDAYEKTQFDIYYIKNDSLFLDLSILLKTIKFFITNHR